MHGEATGQSSAARVAAVAAPARPSGEFHIPSLDGIRAFSFLIVFAAHAGAAKFGIPGGFGVTVFFFLSGYLITTLLRLEFTNAGTISLRDFYLRRVLRIFPPFYAVLLVALVLTALQVVPGKLEATPVLAQLGHFTNYWAIGHGFAGQPGGTAVYWSLAVEEHFYLVFPFLFLALQKVLPRRWGTQGLLLFGLCGVVLLWRLYLVQRLGVSEDRTYLASDTRLDSILFGCALALAANPMLDRPRLPAKLFRWVLLPAGVLLLVFCFVYRAGDFRETYRYSLQGLGLAPVFVGAMREPRLWLFRALNLAPVKRVGVLSYTLYLVHHVVIETLQRWLPSVNAVLLGGLALGVALLLANLVHQQIERPCARLRRRLAHAEWLSAPAPAGAATAAAGAGRA